MTNKLVHFIGNWKMFGDISQIKSIKLLHQVSSEFIKKRKRNKIVLCIPNSLINFFSKNNKYKSISIGAQNCHHKEGYGAFTGSESASMIKKVGAEYIILGHSESRIDGDNNKKIKMKIQSALNANLKIIFCIGETMKEKRAKKTFAVIKKQLRESLNIKNNPRKIIIAYEPVWSIGTGNIPNINDLKKIFIFIKKEIKNILKIKKSPILIYGGSVNAKNIAKFSSISEINGFLIGGASRSPKKFVDIIKNYYK
tara:strand:+ start:28 stop:789 length:762 start_codon:yes stop_codon:yes gene_type:complete